MSRVLAIECATEACSAAVFEGGQLIAGACETIGRGHAERLVPMIADLPDKGRAARIAVSLGPGSFTGVRIGLAAARALGLAWGAEVVGYPTLALVAAMARGTGGDAVTVCMTGGHGEWFMQDFGSDGLPEGPLVSLAAADARVRDRHPLVAGSQAAALVGPSGASRPVLPDARCFPMLPPALLTCELGPIYGRAPDARLPGVAR